MRKGKGGESCISEAVNFPPPVLSHCSAVGDVCCVGIFNLLESGLAWKENFHLVRIPILLLISRFYAKNVSRLFISLARQGVGGGCCCYCWIQKISKERAATGRLEQISFHLILLFHKLPYFSPRWKRSENACFLCFVFFFSYPFSHNLGQLCWISGNPTFILRSWTTKGEDFNVSSWNHWL